MSSASLFPAAANHRSYRKLEFLDTCHKAQEALILAGPII